MTYDLLGIGLGPFNLGLAALCHDIPKLSTAFIEQKDGFDWHPGLLLPGARLQVPLSLLLRSCLNTSQRMFLTLPFSAVPIQNAR